MTTIAKARARVATAVRLKKGDAEIFEARRGLNYAHVHRAIRDSFRREAPLSLEERRELAEFLVKGDV